MTAQLDQFLFSNGTIEQTVPIGDHRQQRGDLDQVVIAARQVARVLLQRHSSGLPANFARTGFHSTYHAAANKYGSSMTKEAIRPCHR